MNKLLKWKWLSMRWQGEAQRFTLLVLQLLTSSSNILPLCFENRVLGFSNNIWWVVLILM
jgi:hypothetical protein